MMKSSKIESQNIASCFDENWCARMDFDIILDFSIPFPTIEGVSDRQREYARQLRETYITLNEQRFREIEERMQRENDMRMQMLNEYATGQHFSSYDDDYSEAERACLFGVTAGGIIATLKKSLGR